MIVGRAGYYDDGDIDALEHGRWRAQVASTIRGRSGQAFLRELVAALDALPEKRLIANELEMDGNVCAIGSVGLQRGIEMSKLDPEDPWAIAGAFGITHQLVREIEFMNDESGWNQTPEQRWTSMRAWAVSQIKGDKP